MTGRPLPLLRCAIVLLLPSILSALSPSFLVVVVGLIAPHPVPYSEETTTKGPGGSGSGGPRPRPRLGQPPPHVDTSSLARGHRPARPVSSFDATNLGPPSGEGHNGGDFCGGNDDDGSMTDENLVPRQQQRKTSLFIFGLGNVGMAVAELAARVRYQREDDGGERGLILGLGVADCDDHSERVEAVRGKERAVFGSIVATVRTATATTHDSPRIQCIPFDDRDAVINRLSSATHVLVTVPPRLMIRDEDDNRTDDGPTGTGSSSSHRYYEDPVLASGYHLHIPTSCSWVGYVSTTGVYGDHGGGWVDESSETRAMPSSRAHGYLNVEGDWAKFGSGLLEAGRVSVFRCAGIYSPSSSALHTSWRKQRQGRPPATTNDDDVRGGRGGPGGGNSVGSDHGTTPADPVSAATGDDDEEVMGSRRRESHTSRVHIDDVARAIVSDMLLSPPLEIDAPSEDESFGSEAAADVDVYNLADDEPAPRSVVMAHALELLEDAKSRVGLDDDILDDWFIRGDGAKRRRDDGSGRRGDAPVNGERARRRATDDKRVSNGRMREGLLSRHGGLSYPTYREGLASILNDLLGAGRREQVDVPRKRS